MFLTHLVVVIAAVLSSAGVHGFLELSSDPPSVSGSFCRSGPVNFTCVATDIGGSLFWELNDTTRSTFGFRPGEMYPVTLFIIPPMEGSMAIVTAGSTDDSTTFDVTSVFIVSDVSVLSGSSIHCEEASDVRSNVFGIELSLQKAAPSPSSTSCSLLPSPGGAEVTLQWPLNFTSQHAVERYRVSVTPEPSSCSGEVRPSEDYSCSGLTLGTRYSFTVTAINCRDQEGDNETFTILPQAPSTPTDIEVSGANGRFEVQWNEPSVPMEKCSIARGINYTVATVDNTGMMVEQRTVSLRSGNCSSDGVCSTSFSQLSSEQACRMTRVNVTIMASNALGSSSVASFLLNSDLVGAVRLTSANTALLVVLLGIAIAGCVALILMKFKTRKGSLLYVIPLVVGGVLVAVCVVLWVAVGIQVGLQDDTCDSAWQSTRDNLIISALVFSVVAMLLIFLAAIVLFITQRMKSQGNKLELYKGDKSELGAGGRVEENVVDEFAKVGETPAAAQLRVQEEIHMENVAAPAAAQLRVQEEIHQENVADDAHYSTTQHNIPPVQPDTGTYSQLDTHEAGNSQYSALNHGDGEQGGANKMAATGSGEEYGKLGTTTFGVREPVKMPASDVGVACPICGEKNKPRHCCACGKIFCEQCLEEKAYLPYLKGEGRVCGLCYEHFLKEQRPLGEAINLSMNTLHFFQWRDDKGDIQTFRLVDSVSAKWRSFSEKVGLDPDRIEEWRKKHNFSTARCWNNVMWNWLKGWGKDLHPATWEGVYTLLEDVGCSKAAKQLKTAIETHDRNRTVMQAKGGIVEIQNLQLTST